MKGLKKKVISIITLLMVCVIAIVSAIGCSGTSAATYRLENSGFSSFAVYGEKLDLDGLVVVKTLNGVETRVNVTENMVSNMDTMSAGNKTLTITYEGKTLTIDYVVKYQVKYLIDGSVLSTQHVLSADEIVEPVATEKAGFIFKKWVPEKPQTLEGNISFEAQYIAKPSLSLNSITTWENFGILDYSAEVEAGATYSVSVEDEHGHSASNFVNVSLDEENKVINYDILDKYVGKIKIIFTKTQVDDTVIEKTCEVNCIAKPTLSLGNAGDTSAYSLGFNGSGFIPVNCSESSVKITATTSNSNISVVYTGGLVVVQANKAGVTTITVKATGIENPNEYVIATKKVVVKSRTFLISQSEKKYGIEGIYTLGRTNVKGEPSSFTLNLSAGEKDDIGENFYNNITWLSNNDNAVINQHGTITLNQTTGATLVKFRGKFSAEGIEYYTPTYTIRCVFDGVNVSSYEELYSATKFNNPKPIVLQANIKEDFSATNYDLMYTTYDDTYYRNLGNTDAAYIKVLLQFKNDLYGNGYQINAHNATYRLDATGKPVEDALFKGPLNFVAMSETGGMISVKAQDNICFAIHEGVTISNVELYGCDLTADNNGNYHLTDLDYVGTTVEVFGNANIEYCRITNGRTLVRIFGDGDSDGDGADFADPTAVINVKISNSVLRNSREFLVRMGSNCFKDAYTEDGKWVYSPYLNGDDATKNCYNAKKTYSQMSATEKEKYDAQFIKTFVTIKNSVLKDAGIFAIGIDSHFAGVALQEGHSILGASSKYWKDLAKTSYGAKITFEGDVRLYNWKKLHDIDSSTLIENLIGEGELSTLDFNVKDMVDAISKKEQFTNIITEYQGQGDSEANPYVHAGVAFFGGGKNYSVFEVKEYEGTTSHELLCYEVSLKDVGKGFLGTAAGNEPFYFMVCDATSSFTPQMQEQILASQQQAYAPIYKD